MAGEQTHPPQVAAISEKPRKTGQSAADWAVAAAQSAVVFHGPLNMQRAPNIGTRIAVHFSGTITQRIDGKGRVSIPADFRRVLEAGDPAFDEASKRVRMRVVYGNPERKCLEVYSISAYDSLVKRIKMLPEGTDERELLEMFYVVGSDLVEVDADGRAILAQRLRDVAGLPRDGGEAVFAGVIDLFRIWVPEEFEAERQRKLAAVKARLAGGGSVLSFLPPAAEG